MSHTEKEILRQTAGMVATALGEGWKVDTDPDRNEWNPGLIGPDNERLYLTRGDRNWSSNNVDRVEIVASCSHLAEYRQLHGMKHHTITVRRDRGPEAIAREVERRLLPDYRVDVQRVRDRVSADDSAQAARADAVARITDTVRTYRTSEDAAGTKVFLDLASGSGDVRVNYDGASVDMDLRNISLSVALDLLKLLGAS